MRQFLVLAGLLGGFGQPGMGGFGSRRVNDVRLSPSY